MASRDLRATDAYRARQLRRAEKEVFGPVLHVVRYNRNELDKLVEQINASGYGLTLGVHTRIDETIAQVTGSAKVGNLYVNRNMVGAVVGVQPFGGEGLSGTGPKAGGPLYLYRLLSSRPQDAVWRDLRPPGCRASAGRPAEKRCWKNRCRRCSSGPRAVLSCRRCASSTASRRKAAPNACCRGQPARRNTLTLMPRERCAVRSG